MCRKIKRKSQKMSPPPCKRKLQNLPGVSSNCKAIRYLSFFFPAMDVSADLTELGRTPVAVVSAGVKSILDIGRTLEYLVCTIFFLSFFLSFFLLAIALHAG